MIDREKLREMADKVGLSERAYKVLDMVFANEALEDDAIPYEELGVMDALRGLPEDEARKVQVVVSEVEKLLRREVKEHEAIAGVSDRAIETLERARDLEDMPDHATVRNAIEVLKRHGEEVPITEHDLGVEIEVEDPDAGEWISMPETEIDTDENGIPTRKAAKRGFGIDDPENEGQIIKVYPTQVEAMRALSKHMPFTAFVGEHLEMAADMKRQTIQHMMDSTSDMRVLFPEERIDQMASQMVSRNLSQTYLWSLATRVKSYPRDPQGIIDYCKGKETKAAKRYHDYLFETVVKLAFEEVEAELIEEGVYEVVVIDGAEYLRPGPNYEAHRAEMEQDG